MTTATVTPTRRRRRTRTTGSPDAAPLPDAAAQAQRAAQVLAAEVYELNIQQNELKRRHDRKRAELLGQMTGKEAVAPFAFTHIGSDGPVELEVETGYSKVTKIDLLKLRERVPDDTTFLRCVTGQMKLVTDAVGANIADAVSDRIDGTLNVTVKVKK